MMLEAGVPERDLYEDEDEEVMSPVLLRDRSGTSVAGGGDSNREVRGAAEKIGTFGSKEVVL